MRWVDFMALKQSIGIEQVLEHYGVRPQARAQRFAWPLCAPHPWFRSQPGKLCSADHIWACHSASCRGAQGQMGGTILDLVACMATCTIREAAPRLQPWWGEATFRKTDQLVSTRNRAGPRRAACLNGAGMR
jgi:hypothetical protein